MDIESEFPINVIEVKFGKCGHYGTLLYNEKEEFLTCKDCGEKITAHEALGRIIAAESRFQRNFARYKLLTSEMAKKTKCKCEHCGRMTNIRSEVTDGKVMDLVHEMKRL